MLNTHCRRCKHRALSDEEKALVAEAEDIDSKYTRPTADQVKQSLEKIIAGTPDDDAATPDGAAKEAINELGK